MPWKKVKCNLNYKDKCPGIIYKKDFADFRKKYKCRAPKGRKEVGSTGVCTTCANAERSGVWNARRNAGNQAGTVSGSLGPDAGHQAGAVSGSLVPNAGHQAGKNRSLEAELKRALGFGCTDFDFQLSSNSHVELYLNIYYPMNYIELNLHAVCLSRRFRILLLLK